MSMKESLVSINRAEQPNISDVKNEVASNSVRK